MRNHPVLMKFYQFDLKKNQLVVLWLGQNGFMLRTVTAVILFDPYLSDFAGQWTYGWKNEHTRMTAVPIQPKEIYGVDYVLCSHDHVDHIDPFTIPILALRNPHIHFIAPSVARTRMLGLYVPENNLSLMRGEDTINRGGMKVHAIPASHSNLMHDTENGYHYLSYIIEIDGLTIFHAGDCVPYEKQLAYLSQFKIDLAFLPINGRQPAEYEFEPNFTITEAVDLAEKSGARLTIPMHYDMYTLNTANIADFVKEAEGRINFRVAQIGVPFIVDEYVK